MYMFTGCIDGKVSDFQCNDQQGHCILRYIIVLIPIQSICSKAVVNFSLNIGFINISDNLLCTARYKTKTQQTKHPSQSACSLTENKVNTCVSPLK